MITLLALVVHKLATLGEEGLKWRANLNNLLEELEQQWQLKVEGSLEGGSEAYVAKATTHQGEKVILKVAIPQMNGNTVLVNEVTALTLANGRGYVRLLRFDPERKALLLEQLGLPLKALGYSTSKQIELICTTLKHSWLSLSSSSLSAGSALPTGPGVTEWFSDFIAELWEELDRPCSEHLVEMALGFTQARAKAFDPEVAVLVHGDVHNGNTLQALSPNSQSQPCFKLIDPDGLIAEPAYDLGVLMREWADEMMPEPVELGRERCAYLSKLTGADPKAIWQWGFIQTMSTGLLLLKVGQAQAGFQLLNLAEAWSTVSN